MNNQTDIEKVVKEIVGKTRKGEIGVTVKENGDIRPYRMEQRKPSVSEMIINKDSNISNTVTTEHMPKTYGESTNFRIRKLTPTECYKLMGFTAEDCEKAHYYTEEEVSKLNLRNSKKHKDLSANEKIERISDSQLYKQSGNSIVVNVLEAIFKSLGERYDEFKTI